MDSDIVKCLFGGVVLIVGFGVFGASDQGAEAFRALVAPDVTQQTTAPAKDDEQDELRDERLRLAREISVLREEAELQRRQMARLQAVEHERDLARAREVAETRSQLEWQRLRREEDDARLQRDRAENARRAEENERARWVAADHEARMRAEEERRQAYDRERIAAEAPVVLIPDVVPGVTPPRYRQAERERERETGTARNRRGTVGP